MKEKGLKRKRCNIDNDKIKIAYILGCFLDNTPTFIIEEIVGLDRLGMDITIFSINNSSKNINNLGYETRLSKTIYTNPSYSLSILFSHLYFALLKPLNYLRVIFKYREFGGKRAFWEGVYFSRVIKNLGINHIHAHFVWTVADVARLISFLTNIPFSFTAHARDIYVERDHFKEKLEEAEFIITCTNYNKQIIIDQYGDKVKDKIHVVYHGTDVEKFVQKAIKGHTQIDILSIGRLVEKKGFEYLIEALFLLKNKGININCIIVGDCNDTDLRKKGLLNYHILEDLISDFGIEDNVKFVRPVRQDKLYEFYSRSKMFVLPCVVDKDGDRDGIPNVLVEAMSMKLPVISTQLPNIAELIENGKDGILVPERNAEVLADSIEKLLFDEKLRRQLGKEAREKIVRQFDFKSHIRDLASIFKSTV